MTDEFLTVLLMLGLFSGITCAVVNSLKGKYWMALISVLAMPIGLLMIVGLVCAIRIAKPDSRWARGYTSAKMNEAKRRFPKRADRVDPDWVPAPDALSEEVLTDPQDSLPYEDENWDELDKITRRAREREGRGPES